MALNFQGLDPTAINNGIAANLGGTTTLTGGGVYNTAALGTSPTSSPTHEVTTTTKTTPVNSTGGLPPASGVTPITTVDQATATGNTTTQNSLPLVGSPYYNTLASLTGSQVPGITSNFSINPVRDDGSISSSSLGNSTTYADIFAKRREYENNLLNAYNDPAIITARQQALEAQQQLLQAQTAARNEVFGINTNPAMNQEGAAAFSRQANLINSQQIANFALAQNAAANNLSVLQAGQQNAIAGYNALLGASNQDFGFVKPTEISPGASLVNPINGQQIFNGLGGYTDKQAADTYFNLQQQYPDANIPQYNPQLSPQQNLQIAQSAAQKSPRYQALTTSIQTVQLPGGGIGYYNSKDGTLYNQNGQSMGRVPGLGGGASTLVDSGTAAVQKASAAALNQRIDERSSISRAITTADANFGLLVDTVKKAGINTSAPVFNQISQAFNNKLIGSGDMAAFNALVASVSAEYAQVLSRGGTVTDSTRKEAEQLVNKTISWQALQTLHNTLKAEGGNVVKSYDEEIGRLQGQLGTGQTSTGSTGWYN